MATTPSFGAGFSPAVGMYAELRGVRPDGRKLFFGNALDFTAVAAFIISAVSQKEA